MSTPSAECRLLFDPPAEGAWNMAVDEALIEAVADSQLPVLRFYQWQRPTLSLGYFQNVADRVTHSASSRADIVRRLSGGGAILHDHELTYSFLLPATHPLARDTQQLYDCVHEAIVAELETLLLSANTKWQPVLCEASSELPASEQPFLCFLRRSKGDILLRKTECENVTDHKIVGSAQRRRRGTVLQHGSIIFNSSQAAPEIFGINDLCKTHLVVTDLLGSLTVRIAQNSGLTLIESELSACTLQKASNLRDTKYARSDWTDRR